MFDNLLVPVRNATPLEGRFPLGREVTLAASAPETRWRQLKEEFAARGTMLRKAPDSKAQIRLLTDAQISGSESYRLDITPQGIEIRAAQPVGTYYGVQTLRELLRGTQESALAACAISDSPDYSRRGVYLDCSRGRVPSTRCLKDFIELLAHWKVNELQLYIENVFQFRRHPQIGRGYSPFSPEDILELQEHCGTHHMRFVGSLASFGHMEKVLQIPSYRGLGEMPGFQGWPGGTTLCPRDPKAYELLEDLYAEFVPLFKAEDFNVCGDEPWELGRGRSILRARWFGVPRLYVDFLKKLQRLCERHNKRMNAWADIVLRHADMLGELPRDMVLLNWDYDPPYPFMTRTREITDRGLPAVACPGTHGWFSHGSRLKMGMDNIAKFAGEGLSCGAAGFLNTDWGNKGHRNLLAVSLHNLAWGAAHGWNHAATREDGFTQRFCRQTFGSDFAAAITALGGDLPADPPRRWDAHLLYNGLIPSVQASYNHMEMALDALEFFELQDFRDRDALLSSLRWPEPSEAGSRFLSDLLEECRMAAQMEILSCRRCHVLKRAREGTAVRADEWRTLIQDTKRTAAELGRVWRLGNRPSRLIEHLRGFSDTVAEYRRHSRTTRSPRAARGEAPVAHKKGRP